MVSIILNVETNLLVVRPENPNLDDSMMLYMCPRIEHTQPVTLADYRKVIDSFRL